MIDLHSFAAQHGIKDADIVRAVQIKHPKYDKYIHAKAKKPDDYGIRLLDSVERMLEDMFPKTSPAPDMRQKPRRQPIVGCRVPPEDKERLQQAFQSLGYETMQDGMRFLVQTFLKNHVSEEEAP